MIPTAQKKCYLTADNRLVAEGDPAAKFLFAMPGEPLNAKRAEGVENVGDFFDVEKPKKADPAADEKPAAKAQKPKKADPA